MNPKIGQVCPGCGAPFQSDQPEAPGYLGPQVVEKRGSNHVICRSCYRLAHYGEFGLRHSWDDAEFLRTLAEAVSLADLILIVADLPDFEGSWWPEIWSLIPSTVPVFVLANKVDLLPDRADPGELIRWVQTQTRVGGRRPERVFLVSARLCSGIDRVQAAIGSGVSSIAIMGATNSGKSSLVNCILPRGNKASPVVSSFPGTTLGIIPVQIDQSRSLLDTPGLIPPGRLSDHYCHKCIPQFIASKALNSRLYELRVGQSLLFGGVGAITVEKCDPADSAVFICHFPDGVVLHRSKQERVPELIAAAGDWLVPPCPDCNFPEYSTWDQQTVELRRNQDLAIAGLGWVSLRRTDAAVRLHLPSGIRFRVRPALIGPQA